MSRAGSEVNEDCDEEEHQVPEKPEKAQHESEALAHAGGDGSGLGLAAPQGEERAEHAAPVHREGGDQIEEHKK